MTTPKLTLTASKAATEGGANGIFTINLDTPAPVGGLLVRYNVAGSSAASSDYTVLAGDAISALTGNRFLIAAGASSATLQVQATADGLTEAVEAVALTLNVGDDAGVSFAAQQTFAVAAFPWAVGTGDFNGDGLLDIVASGDSDKVSLLLGNGQGGFAAKTDFAVGQWAEALAVADVNGDGRLDVLTANYLDNNISLLLGNGAGGFTKQQTFTVSTNPNSIGVVDVNGDGRLDVLTANANSDNVSLLVGDGAGGFAKQQTFAVGNYPHSISVGDVNGDGRIDILTANMNNNNVSLLVGDGAGGFATQQTFAVGNAPHSMSVSDVNGDGRLDVLTANYLDNNISLLVGDSAGGFATQQTFAVGITPYSVNVGDVNGDGQLDVLTAHGESENVSLLLGGDGAGGFAKQQTFAVGTNLNSISVVDVNGDGRLDVLTANVGSNNVSLLLNTTTTSNPAQTTTANLTITDPASITEAGFTLTPLTSTHTSENGSTVSYAIALKTAPLPNLPVMLGFSSSDSTEGVVDTPQLTFTSDNYATPQTLTVRGVNDSDNDGDIAYQVTGSVSTVDVFYKDLLISPLNLVNEDDGLDVVLDLYGDANGSSKDVLQGQTGADKLHGLNMADYLAGGLGNDTLWGGYGDDVMLGEGGDDFLYGEQENDYLTGGDGNDSLDGGDGKDTMSGGAGNDTYYLGYDMPDVIDDKGLASDVDTVIMPYQLQKFTLPKGIENGAITGVGNSSLTGNTSNNKLTGNDGNNNLDGSAGRDALRGGGGNDLLIGGDGNDTLTGGAGRDSFKFTRQPLSNIDKITDFSPKYDRIQLDDAVFNALKTGVLTAAAFNTGTTATDRSDKIIYDKTSGGLFYDDDGLGGHASVKIAALGVNLALTANDFVVA